MPLIVLLTISCTKEEGFGGKSTIKGVLIEKVYNKAFTNLQYTQVLADEDVFIVFDDDKIPSESNSTSENGNFEFNYLQKGNYSIYYYTDDTTLANRGNTTAFKYSVSLGKKNTKDLDTLYTYKFIDYDDGFAKVKGTIKSRNFTKNFVYIDETSAQDYDVFLVYEDENSYSRERTIYNGNFEFKNLILGSYKIYTYSDNKNNDVERLVVSKEFEITKRDTVIDLSTLLVNHID